MDRSRTRSRIVRALALAVGCVAIVYFAMRGGDSRREGGAVSSDAVSRTRGEPPTAVEPSADLAQPPDAPIEPDERIPSTNDEPPSEPWARFFVAGTVLGPAEALDHAVVIVRPGPNTAANRGASAALANWGKPDALGRFRLELSRPFRREIEQLPSVVSVQAVFSGFDPVEVEVPVPFQRADFERERELEVRTELVAGFRCVVRGAVIAPSMPDLSIDVFAFRLVDGEPNPEPRAVGQTRAPSGEFELGVQCDEDLVLLAFAEGFRPATLAVGTQRGSFATIELDRGAALSGHFRADESGPAYVLAATRTNAGRPIRLPQCSAVTFEWREERFQLATATIPPLPNGSFEISGLEPDFYDLQCVGSAPRIGRSPTLHVLAPSSGIELGANCARIVLEVRDPRGRSFGFMLDVRESPPEGEPRSYKLAFQVDRPTTLWVAPFTRLDIGGTAAVTVVAGEAGSATTLLLDL